MFEIAQYTKISLAIKIISDNQIKCKNFLPDIKSPSKNATPNNVHFTTEKKVIVKKEPFVAFYFDSDDIAAEKNTFIIVFI